MTETSNTLRLKRLGIDTHQEAVIYMRRDCHVCRAEGFSAHARVRVSAGDTSIIATLNRIRGPFNVTTAGQHAAVAALSTLPKMAFPCAPQASATSMAYSTSTVSKLEELKSSVGPAPPCMAAMPSMA